MHILPVCLYRQLLAKWSLQVAICRDISISTYNLLVSQIPTYVAYISFFITFFSSLQFSNFFCSTYIVAAVVVNEKQESQNDGISPNIYLSFSPASEVLDGVAFSRHSSFPFYYSPQTFLFPSSFRDENSDDGLFVFFPFEDILLFCLKKLFVFFLLIRIVRKISRIYLGIIFLSI